MVCTHLVLALGRDPSPLMAQGPCAAHHGAGRRLGSSIPEPGRQRAVFPWGLAGRSRPSRGSALPARVLRGDSRSGGDFTAAGPPAPAWTTVSFLGWSLPSQSLSSLSRVRFRGLSLAWGQGEVRLAHLPVVVFRGLSFKMTSEHRHVF